jgi:small basic protein
MVIPLVLLVIGVVGLEQGSSRPDGAKLGILIALLAVDAVGLGAVRAWTVRLWRDAQGVLRLGTWVTVVLWLVGLGIHEGVDVTAHIPAASTLLYLGVTFLARQLVLQARASRLEQQPPGTGPGSPPSPSSAQEPAADYQGFGTSAGQAGPGAVS